MRKFIVYILLLLCVVLCGCSAATESPQDMSWRDEDFALYDADGKELARPTADDSIVNLSSFNGARTHRGIKIGDPWEKIAEVYGEYVEAYMFSGEGDILMEEDGVIGDEVVARMKKAVSNGELAWILVSVVHKDGEWIPRRETVVSGDVSVRQYVFNFTIQDFLIIDCMIQYMAW